MADLENAARAAIVNEEERVVQLGIATAMVAITVVMHLAGLALLVALLRGHRRRFGERFREWSQLAAILGAAFGLFALHTAEIWAYALLYEPDVKYPRFIEGDRRCPPEDVGGLPGFEMFLDAMAEPTHEEHDRLREWYGGPYNPGDIDERFIRRAVAAIAIRRHNGKLAYQKSRAQ